ncbi:DOPA 4,5-dioxygenase [Orchesella cincta]|uniref:DOPA 4,5-dioxygenase n=1 Tax=Orchesella cincta TaxID=48709 RepID=A0A1D2MCF1_ORCCI|nr:DOPA 4,5-dioxygenase [Orchesella cincta]
MKAVTIAVLVAFVAAATAQSYYEEEIGAWHFHVYFFEVNPSKTAEAQALRLASRQMINSGALPDCSLNQVRLMI